MIGFIDSIVVHSLLTTINYNNSQLVFSRTLPWLSRTRSILVLRLSPLYFVLCPLIIHRHGPLGKHVTSQECVFCGSLPSNGCHSGESVTSGIYLPSRCLAMVIYITICMWHFEMFCCTSRRWFILCLFLYILPCVGRGKLSVLIGPSRVGFLPENRETRLRKTSFQIRNRTMGDVQKGNNLINSHCHSFLNLGS
jgi:hypothetical protein